MDPRNIVITGFMGTGKTEVGRLLAARLKREFVDMDHVLADRAGLAIAEIFERYGEPDFRARESSLCRELAARRGLVIATGGGALVSPENRAAFANADIVCLDASVNEILHRLNGQTGRPLLAGDPRARIESLLAARHAAYAEIPWHIDTDGRTPDEAASEIAAAVTPRTIPVRTPNGRYSIHLGRNLIERVGDFLEEESLAARCAVVTNPIVGALYGDRALDSLRRRGLEPVLVEVADGEQFKTLDTVRTLYDRFLAARLERRSAVIALGGGVIGDTAGFAAATFLRGVPFVQVPTTLLSIVDSSIGGKVAVDLPAGKNLVGAFKFPAVVIADTATLETLAAEEYRAGMAEVIKHAIIGAPDLFEALQTRPLGAELLARALAVKVEIVEQDPFEANVRAHLNLGHTFGQAIEPVAGYQLRHGYAVAVGIAAAARLAVNLGLTSPGTRDAIIALLDRHALPTRVPHELDREAIFEAMGADKKIRDKKLRFVLPRAIGRVELVTDVPREEIVRALEESY
jgi:3-dehydroquinate synthase